MITRLALAFVFLLSTTVRAQLDVSLCTAPDANLYRYEGLATEVYDGDTIRVDLLVLPDNDVRKKPAGVFRLGDGMRLTNVPVRLRGIDAPELRGGTPETKAKAKASRDFLASVIMGKRLIVVTDRGRRGKYGRLIVDIYFHDGKLWHNASDMMTVLGYAERREY